MRAVMLMKGLSRLGFGLGCDGTHLHLPTESFVGKVNGYMVGSPSCQIVDGSLMEICMHFTKVLPRFSSEFQTDLANYVI